MLQIGITGGIGSGKSTVCKIFQKLGISVYDADSRAKKLMNENESVINQVISEFGADSYSSNHELNRDFLAASVFSNPEKLKKLNSIVHPAVAIDYAQWANSQRSDYIIKEAALLIESGSYKQLNKLIVVHAPIELRVQRIKSRDPHRSEEEIKGIIDNQLSDRQRNKYADYLINNDESELVMNQVIRLDSEFRSL